MECISRWLSLMIPIQNLPGLFIWANTWHPEVSKWAQVCGSRTARVALRSLEECKIMALAKAMAATFIEFTDATSKYRKKKNMIKQIGGNGVFHRCQMESVSKFWDNPTLVHFYQLSTSPTTDSPDLGRAASRVSWVPTSQRFTPMARAFLTLSGLDGGNQSWEHLWTISDWFYTWGDLQLFKHQLKSAL